MNCRRAQTLLEDFRDGRVSDADEQALQEHLSVCGSCRRRLTELDRLDVQLARQLGSTSVSAGFADRVMEAVRRFPPSETSDDRRFWQVRIGAAAAAAAAAAVLAMAAGFGALALRQGKAISGPCGRPEERFYEPDSRSAWAVGKPFVITLDGPRPYPVEPQARCVIAQGGACQMVVEAFPEGGSK